MKFYYNLITLSLISIFSDYALAQSFSQTSNLKHSGFYNITQAGYNSGFGKFNLEENFESQNNGYLVRLRTIFGYFLSDKFSLGLGFGLEGYHSPTYNLAPLILDARYYLKGNEKGLFFNANSGYSLKFSDSFEKGFINSINTGYKIIIRNKIHLLPSIGIDFHQIKNDEFTFITPQGVESKNVSFWLKSVSFNLGILL